MGSFLGEEKIGQLSFAGDILTLQNSTVKIGGRLIPTKGPLTLDTGGSYGGKNILHYVYVQLIGGVPTLQYNHTLLPSAWFSINPLSQLVGAFYSNGNDASDPYFPQPTGIGALVNIDGPPTTLGSVQFQSSGSWSTNVQSYNSSWVRIGSMIRGVSAVHLGGTPNANHLIFGKWYPSNLPLPNALGTNRNLIGGGGQLSGLWRNSARSNSNSGFQVETVEIASMSNASFYVGADSGSNLIHTSRSWAANARVMFEWEFFAFEDNRSLRDL